MNVKAVQGQRSCVDKLSKDGKRWGLQDGKGRGSRGKMHVDVSREGENQVRLYQD